MRQPCALPSDREEKLGPLAGFALRASAIAAVALVSGQALGQPAIAPLKVTASAVFVLTDGAARFGARTCRAGAMEAVLVVIPIEASFKLRECCLSQPKSASVVRR